MRALQADLQSGALALGLALSDAQLQQLLDYLDLLQKWGRVYNLTALRDPRDMLTHHLLDSLAVVEPLRGYLARRDLPPQPRLLDVGSGAGLPGVVIAICCPGVEVACVDAVAKKAAFVQQVASNLKLPLLCGVHSRVENLTQQYPLVISRAFASLADFTKWSSRVLAADGVWIAMKGKRPDAEIAALPEQVQVFHVEQLLIPGLDAQRCLVWMKPRTGP